MGGGIGGTHALLSASLEMTANIHGDQEAVLSRTTQVAP